METETQDRQRTVTPGKEGRLPFILPLGITRGISNDDYRHAAATSCKGCGKAVGPTADNGTRTAIPLELRGNCVLSSVLAVIY
jgi:hypothetical protein